MMKYAEESLTLVRRTTPASEVAEWRRAVSTNGMLALSKATAMLGLTPPGARAARCGLGSLAPKPRFKSDMIDKLRGMVETGTGAAVAKGS